MAWKKLSMWRWLEGMRGGRGGGVTRKDLFVMRSGSKWMTCYAT